MYEANVQNEVGKISFNFSEGKAYLESQLEIYKGMQFTEETKKQAKDTVAELRKQKKAFSDRIKEVKNEYMKPFDVFLIQANCLLGLYEEPIEAINKQIDEFETKRIAEKKEAIQSIFGEIICDMSDVLPLNKIYNNKWENATFTEKQIKEEMMTIKENVKTGLSALEAYDEDFRSGAKEYFLNNSFDLPKTIIYINEKIKQRDEFRQKEAERIRVWEEERIRREERMKMEAEQAVQNAQQSVIDALTPDISGIVDTYEYRIKLTADAKEKLDIYLNSVGIEFDSMIVF